jgi:hypothetical protein
MTRTAGQSSAHSSGHVQLCSTTIIAGQQTKTSTRTNSSTPSGHVSGESANRPNPGGRQGSPFFHSGTTNPQERLDFRTSILIPPISMPTKTAQPAAPLHRTYPTSDPSSTSSPRPGSNETFYGTRTQTVVLAERGSGRVVFVERDAYQLDPDGNHFRWSGSARRFEFEIQ